MPKAWGTSLEIGFGRAMFGMRHQLRLNYARACETIFGEKAKLLIVILVVGGCSTFGRFGLG